MARVLFINNDGGGFADYTKVDAGTTITEFFHAQMGDDASPSNYLIRVNRQPVNSTYELVDGDRVTITPTKVEGAARVLFINNDGGGFADYTKVDAGTTITEFFHAQMGDDANPSNYLIRVNRQPVNSTYELVDGDRVTITPTKVEGAGLAA